MKKYYKINISTLWYMYKSTEFSSIICDGPIPMLKMLAWNGDGWIGAVMGFGFDCCVFAGSDPPSTAASEAVGGANGEEGGDKEEEEAEPKEKEKKMSRKELKKLKKQVQKHQNIIQ